MPTAKELKKTGEEFDFLFFVGSMGSYDNRSQKITQSFTRLLNRAGVKLATLGNEEKTPEIHRVALEMNFYSKSWQMQISKRLKSTM